MVFCSSHLSVDFPPIFFYQSSTKCNRISHLLGTSRTQALESLKCNPLKPAQSPCQWNVILPTSIVTLSWKCNFPYQHSHSVEEKLFSYQHSYCVNEMLFYLHAQSLCQWNAIFPTSTISLSRKCYFPISTVMLSIKCNLFYTSIVTLSMKCHLPYQHRNSVN